jgi:hypothetical protein
MELSLQDIKELITMMTEFKLERLEFAGLVLTKSKYQDTKIEAISLETRRPEDPAKTLVSAVSDQVPEFLKGNEALIFAPPFREPMTARPKKE